MTAGAPIWQVAVLDEVVLTERDHQFAQGIQQVPEVSMMPHVQPHVHCEGVVVCMRM